MTLIIHHVKQTRSLRPLWLMEELGLAYELVDHGASIAHIDMEAYAAVNPMKKLPAFFDGDKAIYESLAICEYIAQKYGDGKFMRTPQDDDYADYLQLFHFGEAGMGGYIGILLAHTILLPEKQRNPHMAAWAKGEMAQCLAYLESKLSDDGYLLGSFSLVDISNAYILFLLKISKNAQDFGPRTNAYFSRIRERDAWKRATEK